MFCVIHNNINNCVLSAKSYSTKSPMEMLYIYAGCRATESSLQSGVSIFSCETVMVCLKEHVCAISAGNSAFEAF